MRPWTDHLPAGTDPATVGTGRSSTLLDAWSRRWQDDPEAPLWLERGREPNGPGKGGWWVAGRFDEATRRAAGRLQGAGVEPGARVLWSARSSVAALVAHVGALRSGAVVVPVNPAATARELAHVLDDAEPSLAVVEDTDVAARLRGAPASATVPPVVGVDLDLPDAEPAVLDAAGPDDPALLSYTSGTTGRPKGAVLRHRNLLAGAASVAVAWRWGPDDRLVHALPTFHAHGLCVGVYGTLFAGGSAVLLESFDPVTVVDAARDERGTMFFGVPTMYHRLVRSGQAAGLSGLRLCVSGSAPLARELHGEASRAIGSAILERYGMTETLMISSNPYEGERRAGTVGFPLPHVEVGLAVRGDDLAEILVRGPNLFDGYWRRPAESRDAFEPAADGGPPWFRTGDLGADLDGSLVVKGRSKELIISGGYNVSPAEVEDVLGRHPRVTEVAVAGTPSDEWGEIVTAWVVPDGRPPTPDELAEFAGASLAPYKLPRLVRVVDELPRNSLGKVVRSRLGR